MRIRTLLPVLLTPVLLSCDGLFDSERRPAASVGTASGDAQTGQAGSELHQPLVVVVRDARERPVLGAEVRWRLPSGKGLTVTATSATGPDGRASVRWRLPSVAGEHAATATVGSLPAATFRATATPGPLARLGFADTVRSMLALDSVRLDPGAADRFGNPVPAAALTWSSTDTAVAVVSASGVLRARSGGEVQVTALAGDLSTTLRVTVLPRVARLSLWMSGNALLVGSTTRLDVFMYDAGFRQVTGRSPEWASLDTTVATVSRDGLVRGVRPGTAPMVATIDGVADTAEVRVVGEVASVAVVSAPELVYRAHSALFTARVTAPGGYILGQEVVRWSSSDPSVAVVDSTGLVTAVASGRATIRAHVGARSDSARVRVAPLRFAHLDVGTYNPCGVTTEGETFCWGPNVDGAVGNGALHTVNSYPGYLIFSPQRVGKLHSATAGEWYGCALDGAGQALCWGKGEGTQRLCGPPGMRGASMYVCSPIPVVRSAGPYASISAGAFGACALRPDGTPVCWRGAEPVGAAVRLRSVSVGGSHACGLTDVGEALCWGDNRQGQLGRGAAGPPSREMQPIAGGRVFRSISAGSMHTCGVTEAGEAYCWGAGSSGQLGAGAADTVARAMPARVAGPASYVSISAGFRHTCAVTTGGTAQCWGYAAGPLGTGSTEGQEGCSGGSARCTPTEVVGGHRWRVVEAGAASTCGIATDGITWCWGHLPGDGGSENTAAPVRVVGQL